MDWTTIFLGIGIGLVIAALIGYAWVYANMASSTPWSRDK